MSKSPTASQNLQPWEPGQSGNPSGSSKRQRAQAAARRISGLGPAVRELLDQICPKELLSELTPSQMAALDAEPTLARYLAARLVTAAAAANSPVPFLESLRLIATLDSGAEETQVEVVETLPPLSGEAALALKRKLEDERF